MRLGRGQRAKGKQCRDITAPEYLEKMLARRKRQEKKRKTYTGIDAGGGVRSGTQRQRGGNERSGPWKKGEVNVREC